MTLPGKLTERHIKAHVDMGNNFFMYKGQRINVPELWKKIQEEKKGKKVKDGGAEGRNRQQTISSESKEDRKF